MLQFTLERATHHNNSIVVRGDIFHHLFVLSQPERARHNNLLPLCRLAESDRYDR